MLNHIVEVYHNVMIYLNKFNNIIKMIK